MATIGTGRGPLIKSKSVAGATKSYIQFRFEGETGTGGTPGLSSCIYEMYVFENSYVELRLGNWAAAGTGTSGHYTAAGVGTSFSPAANTSYVWDASGTTTVFNVGYTYVNGALVAGSVAPSAGASAAASWPPSGFTSSQNASADDAYLTYNITTATFFGTSRSTIYLGSNMYLTFGAGSTVWSGVSTTNPALDKFMINAADRSYQRVGYKTGAK